MERRLRNLADSELIVLLTHGDEDVGYEAEQELLEREAEVQERLESMHDPGYIYDLTHEPDWDAYYEPEDWYGVGYFE